MLVSAWPEPPSAIPADKSAGVGDGMEAFALGGTETPPKPRISSVVRRASRFLAALNLVSQSSLRENRVFLAGLRPGAPV